MSNNQKTREITRGSLLSMIRDHVFTHFRSNSKPEPAARIDIAYPPKGAYSNIKRTKGGEALAASKVPVFVDRTATDGVPVVLINPCAIVPVENDQPVYGKVDAEALFAYAVNGLNSVNNPPQPRENGGSTTYTAAWGASAKDLGLDKSRLKLDTPSAREAAGRMAGDLKVAGLWDHLCASAVPEKAEGDKVASFDFFLALDKAGEKQITYGDKAEVLSFKVSKGKAARLRDLIGKKPVYLFERIEQPKQSAPTTDEAASESE